jgi:hypothetical protein
MSMRHGHWRAAAADVERAYHHWCTAPRRSRSEAYAIYVAAMDREAAAASDLRRVGAEASRES